MEDSTVPAKVELVGELDLALPGVDQQPRDPSLDLEAEPTRPDEVVGVLPLDGFPGEPHFSSKGLLKAEVKSFSLDTPPPSTTREFESDIGEIRREAMQVQTSTALRRIDGPSPHLVGGVEDKAVGR